MEISGLSLKIPAALSLFYNFMILFLTLLYLIFLRNRLLFTMNLLSAPSSKYLLPISWKPHKQLLLKEKKKSYNATCYRYRDTTTCFVLCI